MPTNIMNMLAKMNPNHFGAPLVIVLILSMMVLPLPAFLIDFFFTFNIAISLLILMVAINTKKTLEFAVFPTVLLIATLMRLSLNIASTRIVLLEGHQGGDAAGKVIEAFGQFLIGGNYAVGIIIFIIMTIINFMVITKGAGRVAEVSARFTLDGMPGKQMAIDADLNAGMINEEQARMRRAEVTREAEFFGAMDGSSKFVSGDAMAGIIITFINLLGGLFVGLVQHNLPISQAAATYTILTIGDGLVGQIPGIITSIATGIVITRVSDEVNITEQFKQQVFLKPQAMLITAIIIGLLGIIPGMPNMIFLILAGMFGFAYWKTSQILEKAKNGGDKSKDETSKFTEKDSKAPDASWQDVVPIDMLSLELGYRLITLVDKNQPGNLLSRISALRKKFAQEIGFLPAPIHIKDNLELKPNSYRILLKGVEIGNGDSYVDKFLAINPGTIQEKLPGLETKDPTFGLTAVWIDESVKDKAQSMGFMVVDPSTVLATQLNHLSMLSASDLFGREEVQHLIEHLSKVMPKLLDDLVPKVMSVGTFQKVLQNLLEEGISIRDMRTIVEVLHDNAIRTQNPDDLTVLVRIALSKSIVQTLFPNTKEVQVIALDPAFEKMLVAAVTGDGNSSFESGMAETLVKETASAAYKHETMGIPQVLMVPQTLRMVFSKFLRRQIPELKVLSNNEIPSNRTIKITTVIGKGRA
jgi:flagellar biosynthesis protein FlhA